MKVGGLLTGAAALSRLKSFHPIVIEGGTGRRDQRDPDTVARLICAALRPHLPAERDAIVVIQGDPLEATGISAITRRVADELRLPRALVTLDASIDADHARSADRERVVLEVSYSELAATVPLRRLEAAVDAALDAKNRRRRADAKRPLAAYYRDYALLQEVAKAGVRASCGAVTVAHTAPLGDIPASSVTSFYEVGLALDLYSRDDLVPYPAGAGS